MPLVSLGGDANAPGPRKRPLSSMSPTMVFKDGELELVTGSPGGSRIINIVVQMIVDVLDFHMNVAEATEAVRASTTNGCPTNCGSSGACRRRR